MSKRILLPTDGSAWLERLLPGSETQKVRTHGDLPVVLVLR